MRLTNVSDVPLIYAVCCTVVCVVVEDVCALSTCCFGRYLCEDCFTCRVPVDACLGYEGTCRGSVVSGVDSPDTFREALFGEGELAVTARVYSCYDARRVTKGCFAV